MLMEDREILHQVWEARIPTCITLSPEDSTSSLTKSEPMYAMLPTMSYLFLAQDKIKKNFQKHIDITNEDKELWFEYNGTPLKLQYPIGVLFDLFNKTDELTWNITLRHSKPPKNIMTLSDSKDQENYFLFAVKEADALKHRGNAIKNIPSKELTQLWQGLYNDKFDQFWSINHKLMDNSSMKYRNIPFRLHFPLTEDGNYSVPLILPQPAMDSTGQQLTMADLVKSLGSYLKEGDVLMTQTLVPPMDTPLVWMSMHLSYPDNFLHFVVVRN